MFKLPKQQYPMVAPVFQQSKQQIVIGSVIEGHTPGVLYVNHLQNPSFIVLWNKMGEVCIEGSLSNENLVSFSHVLIHAIIPELKGAGFPYVNIYYPQNHWADIITEFLKNLSPVKLLRYSFQLDRLKMTTPSKDLKLKKMDNDLLFNNRYMNLEHVLGWINSFWFSPDMFLDRGIGYCLVKEDIIVSWCLSVFLSGKSIEFGLETAPKYRGQGFAKVVGCQCISDCLQISHVPYWNCDAHNVASRKVAEAIGFKLDQKYTVCHIPLHE